MKNNEIQLSHMKIQFCKEKHYQRKQQIRHKESVTDLKKFPGMGHREEKE